MNVAVSPAQKLGIAPSVKPGEEFRNIVAGIVLKNEEPRSPASSKLRIASFLQQRSYTIWKPVKETGRFIIPS